MLIQDHEHLDIFPFFLELSFLSKAKESLWKSFFDNLGIENQSKSKGFDYKFASLPEKLIEGKSYLIGQAHNHKKASKSSLHWLIRIAPIPKNEPPPSKLIKESEKTGDIENFFDKMVENWPSETNFEIKFEAKFIINLNKKWPRFWGKHLPSKKSIKVINDKISLTTIKQTFELSPKIGGISKISISNKKPKSSIIIADVTGSLYSELKRNFIYEITSKILSDFELVFENKGSK